MASSMILEHQANIEKAELQFIVTCPYCRTQSNPSFKWQPLFFYQCVSCHFVMKVMVQSSLGNAVSDLDVAESVCL